MSLKQYAQLQYQCCLKEQKVKEIKIQYKCLLKLQMLNIQKKIPKPYLSQLKLQNFIIGQVLKQDANKVIQKLRQLPTNAQTYSHLKRIRNINQQAKTVQVLLCPSSDEVAKDVVLQQLKQFVSEVKILVLPINAPSLKEQYVEWSNFWPINFVEQEIYKEIQHSEAQKQFISKLLIRQEQLILFDGQKILYAAKCYLKCSNGTIDHPIMRMLQSWPKTQQFKSIPGAYYLTKLRLLCKMDICGMCSMALVHSRLDRIYFDSQRQIQFVSQILCCQKLNHRIKLLICSH